MEYLIIIFILIISVVIHEVSHGYAALALGDPTAKYEGRLTLNPLTHLDPVGSVLVPILTAVFGGFVIGWAKPVPFNPYNLEPEKFGIPRRFGEALVAVAGPLSNVAIAIIFGLIIRFGYVGNIINEQFLALSVMVIATNIALAVFNLVPIPPLDGSKILFSILPYRWQSVRDSLERYGFIIIILFISIISRAISPLIGYIFYLLTGLPS